MEEIKESEIANKKRYLKKYRKNRALVHRLEDKLARLDDRLYKIKSPNMSGMVGGSPISQIDLISDKAELEQRINKLNLRGKEIREEIIAEIDELEDTRYAAILEAFFIDCKEFEEIAEETGYTIRHVIRLYSEGIKLLSHKWHNAVNIKTLQ